MKVQWKSVSEEQEMRNSLLRGYRSLIGWCCCLLNMISRLIGWHTFYDLLLICSCCFDWTERDVSRTDRHNTFFSGNDNPGLTLLNDVLMTYCMFNFDLGKPLPLSIVSHFNCIYYQYLTPDSPLSLWFLLSLSFSPCRLCPGDEWPLGSSPVCHSERSGVLLVSDRFYGDGGKHLTLLLNTHILPHYSVKT